MKLGMLQIAQGYRSDEWLWQDSDPSLTAFKLLSLSL